MRAPFPRSRGRSLASGVANLDCGNRTHFFYKPIDGYQGFNLFVIQGFSGVPIHKVALYAIPFFLLMCFAVLLMVVFPQIALWLPAYLAG